MSDAQSLTLPKPTARTRRKVRRPRRPTFEELWWLLFTAMAAAVAVTDLTGGRPVHGVWSTVVAGLYWRAYQRARKRVRPALELVWVGAIIGSVIALDVAGIR